MHTYFCVCVRVPRLRPRTTSSPWVTCAFFFGFLYIETNMNPTKARVGQKMGLPCALGQTPGLPRPRAVPSCRRGRALVGFMFVVSMLCIMYFIGAGSSASGALAAADCTACAARALDTRASSRGAVPIPCTPTIMAALLPFAAGSSSRRGAWASSALSDGRILRRAVPLRARRWRCTARALLINN